MALGAALHQYIRLQRRQRIDFTLILPNQLAPAVSTGFDDIIVQYTVRPDKTSRSCRSGQPGTRPRTAFACAA